jgi:hypothetical protein
VASHDSIFQGVGETYELKDKQVERVESAPGKTSGGEARLADLFAPEPHRKRSDKGAGRRGCPPGLQLSIALREALGNPLFTAMIVVAMAAGLFQLTLMWSIQAGTGKVLDDVINKGSRLDRIEIAAKARDDETTAEGLPSEAVLAGLGAYRRAVPRREILLRLDDSRGRERQDTAYGLIPDDPELGKLEMREGEPFTDQRASSLLISELSVERLFGIDAIGETTVGKRVPIRFRRYAADGSAGPDSTEDGPEYDEVTLDFVVAGVVDRAEAARNYYLPSETLLAIVSWQLDPGASLTVVDGRVEVTGGTVGEAPPWERLHVYFHRLDEVLPAAAYFERRGFSTTADLYRYKWILDTRRFVNWTIGGIVAMVLGIAGLLIISNVVSSVRLKRKEIAVLKLMGMKDRDVVSIFVLSVLLCALLGGAAGFVGGGLTVDGIRAYLTSAYPDSPLGQILTSTWAQAPWALVLCVLVAVGFTALPAWHTARKEAVWTLD